MQPSELVMNPKQVFLSVLVFGIAGLLLFMYLQVCIEEQHPAAISLLRGVLISWSHNEFLEKSVTTDKTSSGVLPYTRLPRFSHL
ncbi:hypothetical protein FD754_005878 [Muntiacus muntjak]|uniref:Carbohydrate sulfotransferase n=1 Tax=Muntiacus muntjak TaxID=9888 RepID=A0A5N3WIT8_MUNMU|nr:hypothetical protein FD754_005878 [Muntiacus muntjak]